MEQIESKQKKVLLDTNFLIACIKQKIDFFEEISQQGFKVLVPENVLRELRKIRDSKEQKMKDRDLASLAIQILKKNKYEKIFLRGKNVDNTIAEFANSRKDIIVATLDRELKKKIDKNKMVIKDKKKLDVV